MAHTVAIADDVDAAILKIAQFMVTQGWADDGAPTATILRSAADTEGRAAYLKLYENLGNIQYDLGDGRSGDNVQTNGGAGGIGTLAAKFYADRWFHVFANDRWVLYSGAGDIADDNFFWAGALETPLSAANQAVALFCTGEMNNVGTAIAVNIIKYGSTANYYVYSDTSNTFHWGAVIAFRHWNASGTPTMPKPTGYSCRSTTIGLGGAMAHKAWWCDYTPVFEVVGYMKDVIMTYGHVWASTGQGFGRCYYNGEWYRSPGFDTQMSGVGAGQFAVFVKED